MLISCSNILILYNFLHKID